MADPTKAQVAWLKQHVRKGGTLGRHEVQKTYDFVGRVRKAGWIVIEDYLSCGWPYMWKSTTITDAGRAAITHDASGAGARTPADLGGRK